MPTAASVTLAELKTFLGISSSADDTLLQAILDGAEQQFLADCNRRERPFAASATDRTEVHDGTGSHVLTLDYPISDVDAIKLGLDVTNPDETLDDTDVEVVVWVAGKRTIERTDGGVWGAAGHPRYVHVTYDAQEDKPDEAKTAIKRLAASLWRQLGSEGAAIEGLDGYSRTLAKDDPFYAMAVASQWEPRA